MWRAARNTVRIGQWWRRARSQPEDPGTDLTSSGRPPYACAVMDYHLSLMTPRWSEKGISMGSSSFTRRSFLRVAGLGLGAAGVTILAACAPAAPTPVATTAAQP